MIEQLRYRYNNLDTFSKREIILNEVLDTCLVIEKICKKKNIDINTLSSSEVIKNKNKLSEKDFMDLLFIYIFYLKEDLGLLLK